VSILTIIAVDLNPKSKAHPELPAAPAQQGRCLSPVSWRVLPLSFFRARGDPAPEYVMIPNAVKWVQAANLQLRVSRTTVWAQAARCFCAPGI
jgi:hypothetical protein